MFVPVLSLFNWPSNQAFSLEGFFPIRPPWSVSSLTSVALNANGMEIKISS